MPLRATHFTLVAVLALMHVGTGTTSGQTADDFFSGDRLHEIRLDLNSRDWEALRTAYQENTYYPCDLTWQGITLRNVGIRSRGKTSRSGTKPGLRVDMDRYAAQQTFLGLKSFVLDNLAQDPSMLKERLTMGFLQARGRPAPREAHARLVVNGEYAGLYAVVESVDKAFLARVLGEDEGHLFEYKWTFDWRFGYLGPQLERYHVLFDPKTHERDAMATLYGPIEAMVRAVNEAHDEVFEAQVSGALDLRDVVTAVALENLVMDCDGVLGLWGVHNIYLYRRVNSAVSLFLPWDKDTTFYAADYDLRAGVADNVLVRRLLAMPEYERLYYTTLLDGAAALAAPMEAPVDGRPARSWLQAEIDRQYAQVREAVYTDVLKPFTNDEFEAAVADLRTIAVARPKYVRCEATKALQASAQEIEAACAP